MLKQGIVGGLALAAAIGCGHSSPAPVPSSRSVLRSVFIVGPDSVAPGTTAQFKLSGIYSDGTQQDVTANATWSSTNPDVLRAGAGGQFTAIQDGDAGVTGESSGLTARKVVTATEPGTVVLNGSVGDSGFGLPGALVEVLTGTGAGKNTTTDANGAFRLFGLAGTVDIRVSLDGYQSATKSVNVVGQPRINFALVPATAPADISGDWQLALTASPSCSLPSITTTRQYTATISQSGSALAVALGGAEFAPDPAGPAGARMNLFRGRVFDRTVVFKLDTYQ